MFIHSKVKLIDEDQPSSQDFMIERQNLLKNLHFHGILKIYNISVS